MTSRYNLPQQQSAWTEVRHTLKHSPIFYVLLSLLLLTGALVITNMWNAREYFIAPVIVFFTYIGSVYVVARNAFWKSFAEANGWTYAQYFFGKSTYGEKGLMFQEGRSQAIDREITGTIDGRTFRLATYRFTTGTGKNSTTHFFTLVSFQFSGTFPHLYLNDHRNMWNVHAYKAEPVPLPGITESKFSLFAPEGRGKEIEALSIFSIDAVEKLYSGHYPYDIEFVDGKMLIFAEKEIDSTEDIDLILGDALSLKNVFEEQLDRAK